MDTANEKKSTSINTEDDLKKNLIDLKSDQSIREFQLMGLNELRLLDYCSKNKIKCERLDFKKWAIVIDICSTKKQRLLRQAVLVALFCMLMCVCFMIACLHFNYICELWEKANSWCGKNQIIMSSMSLLFSAAGGIWLYFKRKIFINSYKMYVG